MDPSTAISLGTSLVGLLGGGGSDAAAKSARAAENGAISSEQGGAGAITGLATGSQGDYNRYNPQHQEALDNYTSYLKQDPFTDQRDTADLTRATQGTAAAYTQARAHLAANLGNRGLDTPDSAGPSSALSGGEAGIESGFAGNQANAQQQLAYNRINARAGNLSRLNDVLGAEAGQDYGRAQSGYQAASGVYGQAAGQYGGLAYQDQAVTNNQQGELLSSLGQAGSSYGYGQGGYHPAGQTAPVSQAAYPAAPGYPPATTAPFPANGAPDYNHLLSLISGNVNY